MRGGFFISQLTMVNRYQYRRRRHQNPHKQQLKRDAAETTAQRFREKSRVIHVISASILSASILIGIVVFQRLEHPEIVSRPPPPEAVAINVSEPTADPPAKPEARSEAVIAELLGFINDPTHAARCKRMHDQADALEHLVAYYDQRGNSLPRKVVNPSVSAVKFKDRELLLVTFQDENGLAWSAPFEWNGSAYRLHWEAMTGFGEISWHDFFKDRPKGHFKVRANFFLPEHEILDPVAKDHVMVLMNHPDLPRAASVLVRAYSDVHRQLARYPRATDIPGIVEIHWPDENADQPVLTRWFHRDWLR